ncbi:MAG: S8 family peptidase [Streptomyces sp.]|uniref:S8 family peptidase n=1 Tax=Streptomyces sp. TaxID=1931 RepID=UPI003D6AA0DB
MSDRTLSSRRRLAGMCVAVATAAFTALAGTSAIAAPPRPDEARILSADSAARIDGSYIVVLKGTASPKERAKELTGRHGGSVKRTYSETVRGFSVKADERTARKLAADPAVAYVEADQRVSATGTQPNPPSWGLDRIDQASLPLNSSYTYPNTASNVTAYIIDTGIRTTHTDFGGRATWGTNTTGDGNNTDCHGHGTHVAGTTAGSAYGVAKSARLVAVKVLDCQGSGATSGVIAGVDWVTANAAKPAVANMSLGGGASTALDNAVASSIASGLTYALAAGNDNANACNSSPARTPSAITVGATTSSDARSSFSNWGTCLDIFAPGSSITSAWNTSDTATNTINGTSMASPHVAGAAAIVLSAHPTWTPQQVRDALVNAATSGVVSSPGTGSPNKLLRATDGGGGGGTCTAGQKLANPGFESGASGWTSTSGVIGQHGSAGQPTHSGSWNAWLNGYGITTTDYALQAVSVPSGCSSYTLGYWLHVDTAETTSSTAYDTLKVQVLSSSGAVLGTLKTHSNLNAASGYTKHSVSLASYAGQSVQIRFYGQEDSSLQTSFVVDDTALDVA